MMALLRSRRLLVALVGVVILSLVITMAVGLITSRQEPEGSGEPPPPAPDMSALGAEPARVHYVDLGEQCTATECFRVVGVESEDLDSEESLETIYTTLLDRGYGRMLPPGEDDPEAVDWADSALTDGEVVIQGGATPVAEDTVSHLILVHASPPATPAPN